MAAIHQLISQVDAALRERLQQEADTPTQGRSFGLVFEPRTAFIARPDENGPGLGESRACIAVDLSAASLMALADELGCD